MKIQTKYDVGHLFWVPRVRKQFVRTETLIYEGEEWERKVFDYKAYAVQKIIQRIEINIHSDASFGITYGVEDADYQEKDILAWYPEANMTDHTEESALTFAESFLTDNPGKEYHGN